MFQIKKIETFEKENKRNPARNELNPRQKFSGARNEQTRLAMFAPFLQNKLPSETQYFFLLVNKIWKKLALELGGEIGDGGRAFRPGLGKPIFNTGRGRKIDS